VVPAGALVRNAPHGADDLRELQGYVQALDDATLPGTRLQWEGRNRIRIHTAAGNGQALSIQESYHGGWHATAAGQPRRVHQDGLGFMWLQPECSGPCEVVLDYDGGWELRLCHWLSWVAIAGVAIVPGIGLMRRRG
jgi:hypothetical protein